MFAHVLAGWIHVHIHHNFKNLYCILANKTKHLNFTMLQKGRKQTFHFVYIKNLNISSYSIVCLMPYTTKHILVWRLNQYMSVNAMLFIEKRPAGFHFVA